MSYDFVDVVRDGPITTVVIDRPDVMNALHPAAHAELAAVFDEFAADADQWVAIVTGAGDRAFCAGNDLRHVNDGDTPGWPSSGFGGLTSRFDLDKPLIAAVNGVALGGGFEIALSCDLVVASEGATFGLPEPRVGLAAIAGGLHRLPRQIGLKRAMDLILTARRVSADEGVQLGFVNQVVARADLMAAARGIAESICELSPMSVRASKQTVLRGLDEPNLQTAIESQSRHPAARALFASADFREGPVAFVEKRTPVWTSEAGR